MYYLFVQGNKEIIKRIQLTIRIQSRGNQRKVIKPILMPFQFTGSFKHF